jgi:hypothetical protein
MDESGMVWQLMFCFQKKVRLRKMVFKRSDKLSRELWWTGSPVAVLKMKTSGKLLRYLDGLVQGILSYIEKLPAPLGEDALCKIQNVLQNNPA